MSKELKVIEAQLANAVMELQKGYVYTGEHNVYVFDGTTEAGNYLLNSTESEVELILHKLAPELEVVEINLSVIILKLK